MTNGPWEAELVGEIGYSSLQIENRKITFTQWGHIHQGVLHYTAGNRSSPFHVRTMVHKLQSDTFYTTSGAVD